MKLPKLFFLSWNSSVPAIMDRYIFLELIVPLLFGLGLFTSLGVAIGALFDLVRRVTEAGLMLHVAIQVLLLKLPEFIVLALPMSVLLVTLMAYSRLSGDSEIIALQSVGVNIYRIIVPGIILSLMITGITFWVNDVVAPAANYQASSTLDRALKKTKTQFRETNIIYPEYQKITTPNGNKVKILSRLFYAEEFDGQLMKNLTVLDRSEVGLDRIITAESGSWNFTDKSWDFFAGTTYFIAPNGSYRNIARFEHQQIDLPRTPIDLGKKCKDYPEMTIRQSRECLRTVQLSGNEKRIRKLRVRIQEKFALPFVCLVFGLLGSSLGVNPQNTGKATSFGICVLVVFSYYLLAFISSSLGIWGVLSPAMSAWLPNFLGLALGGFLLFKSAQ